MTRLTEEVRQTVSPHKFGGSRRAAAAWIISGEGFADEESGDVDEGGYFARIGRTVLKCDTQGFVGATKYDNEYDAREAFEQAIAPSIWTMLEDDAPEGCDAIQDLYSWSLNYDPGRGPFALYLDLLGWTEDEGLDSPLYDLATASLGYLELSKLADALAEYVANPSQTRHYVRELMAAEMRR